MAVDIVVGTLPVFSTNTYSVTEDATPIDPSSSIGGTGQFSVSTNETVGDKGLIGQMLQLSDGAQGVTEGEIVTLTGDGAVLTLTGASALNALNATVSAAPYSGTLGGAFAYYLSLFGITTGFGVDSSITSRAVNLPGWNANGWDQMQLLCSGQQVEVTLVSDAIVLRPIRTNVAQTYRDESVQWTVDNSNIAQQINIFYYNSVQKTNGLAYPQGGQDSDTSIYQVDANQQLIVNIALVPINSDGTGPGVSLASVQQPVATDSIPPNYSGAASVYSIIDQNNNVYPAAQWTANGGSVTVTIGPDSESLVVEIQGPSDSSVSPYRLALPTDGTLQSFYSTLNIVGTGQFYNKKLFTAFTGNSATQTATVAGPTIDNFAINTVGDMFSALLSATAAATGPVQTLSVQTVGINTLGNTGNYTFLTFGQFDAVFGGNTFAHANTVLTPTFAAADKYLFSLVKSAFTNQAFGNVASARVFNESSYYRINSATLTESGVQYTAIQDNIFSDWDSIFATKTFAAFDAVWSGKTFLNYSPYPLKAA